MTSHGVGPRCPNREFRGPVLVVLTVLGCNACTPVGDPGDLRHEARVVLQAVTESEGVALTLADVADAPSEAPRTLRVWRRAIDNASESCTGRVDELGLEDYVRGVLPSEWMATWEPAALEAGAIAARTYASFWVAAGGKYGCADVDDTTWTQVYRDQRHPKTDTAVTATEGLLVTRNGSLVFAEYSAENGSPTEFGVTDTLCTGHKVDGHGRGVCQWGTQRWATQGKSAEWMLQHYYPGARVVSPDQALTDGIDLLVRAGDRFQLTLSAVNIAEDPWPKGSIGVGTDPSAFADDSWITDTRPAEFSPAVGQHQSATLTWWMTAPQVERPQTFAEFFYLDGPASDRPGSSGSWNITVVPSPPRDGPQTPNRPPWILAGVTAVGMMMLAGLWLWTTRRPSND